MAWGDILAACAQATKGIKKEPATQVWIPNDWLASNGLEEGTLPIYIPPHGEYAGFHKRSVAKAVAAGMTIRPTAETCTELLNWWPGELQRRIRVTQEMKDDAKKAGKPEPKMADPTQLRAGPPKSVTDDLLKKWHDAAQAKPDKK
jgi:2'-hydroxyisoflavone reductase